MLVALDANVIDLVDARLHVSVDESEAAESLGLPPHLWGDDLAIFWLLALAPYWRSCVYTFAGVLYDELAQIPNAAYRRALFSTAIQIRKDHPLAFREPSRNQTPELAQLQLLGFKDGDARHVSDAIGLGADCFLTLDKRMLRKTQVVEHQWGIRLMSPRVFLEWAVRHRAPWPSSIPWPWEL